MYMSSEGRKVPTYVCKSTVGIIFPCKINLGDKIYLNFNIPWYWITYRVNSEYLHKLV